MTSEKKSLNLYFIALVPPAEIREEVEGFKKEIEAKHHIKHALKLPAHITLQIPFRMPEDKENILTEKLQKFCDRNKVFQTELEGFDRFSKQVIFIKIKEHQPFILLYEKLQKMMLDFLHLKSHEIASNIHPHITIATRDLKRSDFPKVWSEFKERDYKTSFRMEKLYLLKHNGKTWDIIRKLKFEG